MKPLRILVADDESSIRDTLGRFLRQSGHHVETASDGAGALEVFARGRFDVVITDLNMPRMGGVELVKRLKESAPQVVTIVLTGCGSLDSAVEVLRRGCDDYLLKPLHKLDLVCHSMERCLARRDALVMAASARRVSEAKDNILELVVEDLGCRLAELQGHADELKEMCRGNEPAQGAILSLAVVLAHATSMLQDVRTVHQTISERAVGREVPHEAQQEVVA